MKLTKKQKALIESCREEIHSVIVNSSVLALENNWDGDKICMRATYDSFRILNIIQDKLDKT